MKKKETALLEAGSMMLYQGEPAKFQDIATGKVKIYEDRIEMKVKSGNSLKAGLGGLAGAAVGGAVGVGIASASIKKGRKITWNFDSLNSVSTSEWGRYAVLSITMRDGTTFTLLPSCLTTGKSVESVHAVMQVLSDRLR